MKSLIFSAAMVCAILEGRKTQTRRMHKKPRFRVGDLFYMRETFAEIPDNGGSYVYRATDPDWEDMTDWRWKPSIHMPEGATRFVGRITEVRGQWLQDLSTGDALAEGLDKISKDDGRVWKYGIPDRDGLPGTDDNGWPWSDWNRSPIEAFKHLWTSINGAESWESNPMVFAYSFEALA